MAKDSGWNWTPQIGSSRWRRPITRPSSVQAVLEGGRESGTLDDQGVVAGRGERRRQALEDVGVMMEDRRGLAVHEVRGTDDVTAEDMADGLVTEAHAEDRLLAGEGLDHRTRDAGFGGRARAGRDHHAVGVQREGFLHRDLVVTVHLLFHAQLPEVLD